MVGSHPRQGAADTDTDSDGKDSSVECPTCGKDTFSEIRYMKIHHKRAHGESIAGVDVECANCGKTFRKDTFEAKEYDNHLCSSECKSEWASDNYSGKGNPQWDGGKVSRPCSYCGDTIERHPAFMQSDLVFCDLENCKAGYHEEQLSGEDNPAWNSVTVDCAWCGEELQRQPNQYKRSNQFFCDQGCKAEWRSENFVGEDHPGWKGGYDPEYTPKYRRMRKRVRERDGGCVVCGREQEKNGRIPDVHHIRKVREFDDADDAHTLGNMVMLCREHHRQWEGLPLRPDSR